MQRTAAIVFWARVASLLAIIQVFIDRRIWELIPLGASALLFPNPFLPLLYFFLRPSVNSVFLAAVLIAVVFVSFRFFDRKIVVPRIRLRGCLFFIAVFASCLLLSNLIPLSNLILLSALSAILMIVYRKDWGLLKVAYVAAAASLLTLAYRSVTPLPEMYKIYERNNPSLFGIYDVEELEETPGNPEKIIRRPGGQFLHLNGINWMSDNGRILFHPLAYVIPFVRRWIGPDAGILVSGLLTDEFCPLFRNDSRLFFYDSHREKIPCSLEEAPTASRLQHQILFDGPGVEESPAIVSTWKCEMSSEFEMSNLSKKTRVDRADAETFHRGLAWFPIGKRMLCYVGSRSESFIRQRARWEEAVRARYFDWEYPW